MKNLPTILLLTLMAAGAWVIVAGPQTRLAPEGKGASPGEMLHSGRRPQMRRACTPSALGTCTACTNCTSCRNCSTGPGVCTVCR